MSQSMFLPGTPFMRWAPTLSVVVAPIATAASIAGRAAGSEAIGIAGMMIMLPCMLIVVGLALFLPRPLFGTPMDRLDEREIATRQDVTSRSYGLVAGVGMCICAYMSPATHYGWWTPSHADWQSLLMLLICWFTGLPLAMAHWRIRMPLHETDQ